MVRPAPALAKNSIGAKLPFVNFGDTSCLAGRRFAALVAFAATTRMVLGARGALFCRDLIGDCTSLRLLLSRVQMCAIRDTLHKIMCFIGQIAKSYVFYRTESQKKRLRIPRRK